MTSNLNTTDSLERIPRTGLRSADATAPPRSLSQGATSSRLPAAAPAAHEPQLPAGPAAATAHIGSPLRPIRARTPAATPVTPNAGRGIADTLLQRTQLENSDLRVQLALAQQLAESDRRLADSDRRLLEQQFASDLQIRELTIRAELLAASALVPQPQHLNVVAPRRCPGQWRTRQRGTFESDRAFSGPLASRARPFRSVAHSPGTPKLCERDRERLFAAPEPKTEVLSRK